MKTLKLSTDIWKLKKGELLNEIKIIELSELRAFLKKLFYFLIIIVNTNITLFILIKLEY